MAIVKLPPRTFVNLYAATGFTVGVQLATLNITPNDVSLYASENEPDPKTDAHVPLLFGRSTGLNDVGDAGAWAICVGGGAIQVREA